MTSLLCANVEVGKGQNKKSVLFGEYKLSFCDAEYTVHYLQYANILYQIKWC